MTTLGFLKCLYSAVKNINNSFIKQLFKLKINKLV